MDFGGYPLHVHYLLRAWLSVFTVVMDLRSCITQFYSGARGHNALQPHGSERGGDFHMAELDKVPNLRILPIGPFSF